MIEILLVDDHPHVRRILRELIETYDDLKIIGEAVNGEEAVLFAAKLKPAAVVMDIHLPVLNGVPATTLIKVKNPFTVVIGLTAGDPHEDEKAMIIAGAAANHQQERTTARTTSGHCQRGQTSQESGLGSFWARFAIRNICPIQIRIVFMSDRCHIHQIRSRIQANFDHFCR